MHPSACARRTAPALTLPLALAFALALVLTLLASPARAQASPLKDPALRALADAERYSDLERAAREHAARQPASVDAAVAMALVAADRREPKGLEAAADGARQCTQAQPQAAGCHYALGMVQAMRATQQGMMAALRLAGEVRQSLQRALELEPLLYPARELLMTYYLAAPSMAGGGIDKARALVDAAAALQPDHARLLRSALLAKESRFADAEREIAALKPAADAGFANGLRNAIANLAFAHVSDGRAQQSVPLFERLVHEFPRQAAGPYGLGRAMLALGKPDEAVRLMERARTMDGADRLPIDHRLGEALIAAGNKPAARIALQRFIDNARPGHTNPRNLEAARKLLAELA